MTTCHDTSSWEFGQPLVAPIKLRRIVVGVDGSANSLAALRLAVGLALRDGAHVEAVCAYHAYVSPQYPFAGAIPPYGPISGETHPDEFDVTTVLDAEADAKATLTAALQKAFGAETLDDVTVTAVEGAAHDVLLRACANADLLIVGARGHAGPIGLLLGSTAQACTRHATCPVLVVPTHHCAPAHHGFHHHVSS